MSARGQWRPSSRGYRGQRGYSGTGRSHIANKLIERPPPLPLGELIQKIDAELFESDVNVATASETAEIKGCKLLASFNWASDGSIYFPGIPPRWKPPADTTKLHQDSGEYLRDQNAARHPSHPIEPAAKVVTAQEPSFDTQSLDLFACTSTLGNILGCLRGDDRNFRFTVEAVGKTVFFVRRENAPDEKIPGPYGTGPKGHGHTFPEHYCEWREDVKGSQSHQRILSYYFGGLKLAVRFEADGYLSSQLSAGEDGDEDGDAHAKTTLPEIDGLTVQCGGGNRLIPQHAIFELKTRSIKKKDDDHLSDFLPRLWHAQIPWFIVALHEWGVFAPENITITDARREVAIWQQENQGLLRRHEALLKKLIQLARDPTVGEYEVVCQQPGVLEIRQQGGTVLAPLPEPFSRIWAGLDASLSASDDVDVGAGSVSGEESDAASGDSVDYTACSAEGCGYCGHCRY